MAFSRRLRNALPSLSPSQVLLSQFFLLNVIRRTKYFRFLKMKSLHISFLPVFVLQKLAIEPEGCGFCRYISKLFWKLHNMSGRKLVWIFFRWNYSLKKKKGKKLDSNLIGIRFLIYRDRSGLIKINDSFICPKWPLVQGLIEWVFNLSQFCRFAKAVIFATFQRCRG